MTCLIIFTKYPEPGKVKTRLANDIGIERACELYKVFLKLTFKLAGNANFDMVKVFLTPENKMVEFRQFFPREFQLETQNGGDLGKRLGNAFKESFNGSIKKVIIIGSDSPTLPASYLMESLERLDKNDLVLGPADDGGYYLIGAKNTHEFLFEGIDWSTGRVLQQTLQKAEQHKLKVSLLPEWYDVDDLSSLRRAQRDDSSGRIAQLVNVHPAIFQIS